MRETSMAPERRSPVCLGTRGPWWLSGPSSVGFVPVKQWPLAAYPTYSAVLLY